MASLKVRKFHDPETLERFLGGGVQAGAPLLGGVPNLVGKTLILTSPVSETVTFTAGVDPSKLTIDEILTQIMAGTTGVDAGVSGEGARLRLIEAAPTSGITVSKNGTANALLGFSTTVDTVGTVYAFDPTPTPPCFVSFAHDAPSNSLVLITWE